MPFITLFKRTFVLSDLCFINNYQLDIYLQKYKLLSVFLLPCPIFEMNVTIK
jgi:hypothetical protein